MLRNISKDVQLFSNDFNVVKNSLLSNHWNLSFYNGSYFVNYSNTTMLAEYFNTKPSINLSISNKCLKLQMSNIALVINASVKAIDALYYDGEMRMHFNLPGFIYTVLETLYPGYENIAYKIDEYSARGYINVTPWIRMPGNDYTKGKADSVSILLTSTQVIKYDYFNNVVWLTYDQPASWDALQNNFYPDSELNVLMLDINIEVNMKDALEKKTSV